MSDSVIMTMIVTDANAPVARRLAEAMAGEAGAGMWTVPCTSNAVDVSHWISSGPISAEFAAVMSGPDVLFAACSAAGIDVTADQCSALLETSDVSDDDPFYAMFRLGILMHRPEIGGV